MSIDIKYESQYAALYVDYIYSFGLSQYEGIDFIWMQKVHFHTRT